MQLTVCPELAEQSQSVPEGAETTSRSLGSVELMTGGALSDGPLPSTDALNSRSNAPPPSWAEPPTESEMDASSSGLGAVRVTVSEAETTPHESCEATHA